MDLKILEETTLGSALASVMAATKGSDWVLGEIGDGRTSTHIINTASSISPVLKALGLLEDANEHTGELTVADRAVRHARFMLATPDRFKSTIRAVRQYKFENETTDVSRVGHFMTVYAPNFQVYKAACRVLRSKTFMDPEVSASMSMAIEFSRVRLALDTTGVSISAPMSTEETDLAIWYESVAEHLEKSFKAALRLKTCLDRAVSSKRFDSDVAGEYKRAYHAYEQSKSQFFDVYILGSLLVLSFESESYPMTMVHFTRLVSLFRSYSQVSMQWRDLSAKISSQSAFTRLMDVASAMEPSLVDHFPSGLKGYKQAVIASMDSSSLMGSDPQRQLESTYSPEKIMVVRSLKYEFRAAFHTKESLVNFLNLYRAMPHPDYNPEALFDTIRGLNSPNTVRPSRLRQFEGRVRRTMFTNLYAQKIRVNVEPMYPDNISSAVANAVRALNENMAIVATAESIKDEVWSDLVIRSAFKNPKEYKLAPENKASARKIPFSDFMTEARPGAVHLNDIVEAAVNGEENYLSVKRGYRDYVSLVTKTVDTVGVDGKVDPKNLPLTSCSPKFGEVHKFTTRLFYLATRPMKSVLQTYERTVKQIIARQKGVSITKSARDRRRGVETMARSLGGEAGRTTVYISFDMSEFSKKFPVALTRIFSKVVSEVTGDDDIKTVSEVFRHTYAGFTSDTFTGKIWGIEGGFEGFLNFTWTSIHEVVMQIALDVVGLKGILETFSDDGILMLYVPDSELTDFRHKAMMIQRVYSEYGLEFHFSKTLVSTNVWEFLGDVSVNGALMTQFVKEAGKAGDTRYGKTFSTASSKAESVLAQATSGMIHGASVDSTTVISHFAMLNYLRGYSASLTKAEAFYCMIAPPSLGGFRVPPYIESYTRGMKIPISEFSADIEIGCRHYGNDFLRVLYNVVTSASRSCDSSNALVSQFPLASPSLSIVSGGVTDDLISLAIEKCPRIRLKTNPLRGKLGKALSSLARGAERVLPGVLSELVMSSPVMSAYSASVVFTESQALLSLVGRQHVAMAQRRDTRKVRSAHRIIMRNEKEYQGETSCIAQHLIKVAHPYVRFAPLPPSYRVSLRPMSVKPRVADVTKVTFTFPESSWFDNIPLMEEVETFLPGTSTAIWATEGAPNDPRRMRLRYIQKAAAFLASNPGLESAINTIAHYSGLPAVVDESVGHMSELRYMSGATSSYLTYSPLKSATSLDMGWLLKQVYELPGRADRSSHVSAAKLMATYTYLSSMTRNGKHGDLRIVYFSGSSDKVVARSMLPSTKFGPSGVPRSADNDEFNEAYNEEVSDALAMEALATNLFITKASWCPELSAALASEIATHVGTLMGGGRPPSLGPVVPHAYYPAVEEAIVELTYTRMEAALRGLFSLARAGSARDKPEGIVQSKFLRGAPIKPYHESAEGFFASRFPAAGIEVEHQRFSPDVIKPEDRSRILEIWEACRESVKTALPELGPEKGYLSEDSFLEKLANYSAAGSLYSNSHIVVTSATMNRDGTFASSVLAAYKRAMTEALADVKMAGRGSLIGARGDHADALVAMRASIFPSAHRTEAWNRRVASAIYNSIQAVRVKVAERRWDYDTLEHMISDMIIVMHQSISEAGMLNDDVVERVSEGALMSQPVVSHLNLICTHMWALKNEESLRSSIERRADFGTVADALSSMLVRTIRVIKPSMMTILSGSLSVTESLRKVSMGTNRQIEALNLSTYSSREPTAEELTSTGVCELRSPEVSQSRVVDLDSIEEAVTLVAEAVARVGFDVTSWTTRSVSSMRHHVFIQCNRQGEIIVGPPAVQNRGVADPQTRRWVKTIIEGRDPGMSAIDPSVVSRFMIGSRLDIRPTVEGLGQGADPDLTRLAALASSCRIVDTRLKVIIYLRFLTIGLGWKETPPEYIFKVVKALATGKPIRFDGGPEIQQIDLLRDIQGVFLYLSSIKVPAGTIPYEFEDFIDWPFITQSVAFATGGYIGAHYSRAFGSVPGGVSSRLWVPATGLLEDNNRLNDNDAYDL